MKKKPIYLKKEKKEIFFCRHHANKKFHRRRAGLGCPRGRSPLGAAAQGQKREGEKNAWYKDKKNWVIIFKLFIAKFSHGGGGAGLVLAINQT